MENKIYKINKYPDGSSYVEIINPREDKVVDITFRLNSYEDLWHLGQLVDALYFNRMEAHITLPFLFDSQADRRFEDNQSRGLGMVCDFLNNVSDKDDKICFYVFHPHNPELIENTVYCNKIIDNSEFIIDVLTSVGIYGEREAMGTILMSSDAGGFKPLMKLCDKIEWNGETYSASKSRKWDYGEQKSILTQVVDRQDFEGKDVIIVDDICVYGGTFKGLAKLLREKNVGKLYLAVSHMTVQDLGENPVTNYFDKVFTTNSKYDSYYSREKGNNLGEVHFPQPENLEIIKLFDI